MQGKGNVFLDENGSFEALSLWLRLLLPLPVLGEWDLVLERGRLFFISRTPIPDLVCVSFDRLVQLTDQVFDSHCGSTAFVSAVTDESVIGRDDDPLGRFGCHQHPFNHAVGSLGGRGMDHGIVFHVRMLGKA